MLPSSGSCYVGPEVQRTNTLSKTFFLNCYYAVRNMQWCKTFDDINSMNSHLNIYNILFCHSFILEKKWGYIRLLLSRFRRVFPFLSPIQEHQQFIFQNSLHSSKEGTQCDDGELTNRNGASTYGHRGHGPDLWCHHCSHAWVKLFPRTEPLHVRSGRWQYYKKNNLCSDVTDRQSMGQWTGSWAFFC